MKEEKELVEAAIEASKRAYAPYSHFHVGAALLLSDGTIIPGCNVENASYGLTNCAERTAIFSAIAQGRKDFTKIAIFVGIDDFVSPCGACRQVIHEFGPHLEVLLINKHRKIKRTTAKKLLPLAFGEEELKHNAE
jgi:cytidine deaminase